MGVTLALGALVGGLAFAPEALSSASASAAAKSQNAVATSVTAATFSLAAVLTTGAANPQAALVAALGTGSTRGQLFYLKNFGNLTINAFTLSQTFTGATTVAITYCATTPFTFSSTSTCTAGSPTTTLTGASGTSLLVSLTILAGATRQFSMRQASSTTAVTETLSVSVARSGVRAATVTNS